MPSAVTIVASRPDSAEAMELLAELDAALLEYPYPPESRHAFSVEQLIRESVAFFVASYDRQLAACGGVKLSADYGEVKRMFVRPQFRGKGLGKAILNRLASHARANRINTLRLETGIYQIEAIGLYDGWGFQRRGPFGEYKEDPNTVYFEKPI
ncbi:MAG TPA: GNAT family N-acetyltransferase [Pyrinomonadaceae bacterium]|jgi:putative acetyltransferase|nr:GNAT family N-acetyltransferase [Pyrinomonadaceae bacterium]